MTKNEKYGSDVVQIVSELFNALKESKKLDPVITSIPKTWYTDVRLIKEEHKDKWNIVLSKFIKYVTKYTVEEDKSNKLSGIFTPFDIKNSKITFYKIDDSIDDDGNFRSFNPEFTEQVPNKKNKVVEKSICESKTTERMIFCYELNKPLSYTDALKNIEIFNNNPCYLNKLDCYHTREKSEAEILFYNELYNNKKVVKSE